MHYRTQIGKAVGRNLPDYAELKELHKQIQDQALAQFREKAIGDEVDELALNVAAEIKKEFQLLKTKSIIETRRRCEAAVKAEVDELSRQIKTGQLLTEGEISSKVDLLRQIMLECLEQVTYSDKESFVNQKCAELTALAHKHML